jgi:hypothetical protein
MASPDIQAILVDPAADQLAGTCPQPSLFCLQDVARGHDDAWCDYNSRTEYVLTSVSAEVQRYDCALEEFPIRDCVKAIGWIRLEQSR